VRRAMRFAAFGAAIMSAWAFDAAHAQSNLDAGKSAEQIFADTCAMCHATPHRLRAASEQFLRKHYTTGVRQAAAMAAYLEKALKEPPPPPPPVQAPVTAAMSRRPSGSIEIGVSTATEVGGPRPATTSAAAGHDATAFEE
jgi:hypothetical protein